MPREEAAARDASRDDPEPDAPPDGQRTEMTAGAAPVGSAGATDRAAVRAWAGELTTTAAARWLTPDTVAAIGKAMAVSITRHHRAHGVYPTWAQALTGIDPAPLTRMSSPPETWPLRAAAWRRQLRHRLMVHLKYTRWITYTPAPGSLRVGARGRAWLTGRSTPPAPTPEAR